MRISTSQMQLTSLSAMLDRQSDLSKTQLQLATGKRVVKPSDDPVASAATLGLNQSKATTERYQLNAYAARARLEIEEGTLGSITDQIHRIRELSIRANNDTNTHTDRLSITSELRQILEQMVSLANSKDNNGQYLFSGHQGDVLPVSKDGAGNFVYNGDDGQRLIQIGPSRTVADADPASKVFFNLRSGNGTFTTSAVAGNNGTGIIDKGSVTDSTLYDNQDYTITFALNAGVMEYTVQDSSAATIFGPVAYAEGSAINFGRGIETIITGQPADGDQFSLAQSPNQDLFTTVENLISAFESNPTSPATSTTMHNRFNSELTNLDNALESILNVRGATGARLNGIDTQRNDNENLMLQVDESLSVINDLDYAEAISRLNLQLAGLEAAQATFTKIQGLSLFDYIR